MKINGKPVAWDLFCGAGGVAAGLKAAGFYVIGVDIDAQPNYCGDEFIQGDVFEVIKQLSKRGKPAFIWASPPCQAHTALKHAPNAKAHVDLIPPTRKFLQAYGVPWAIENVEGAPLINPITLCGSNFGLGVDVKGVRFQLRRHRIFETSWPVAKVPACRHCGPVIGIYGGHVRNRGSSTGGRGTVDFKGQDRPKLAATALGVKHKMTMNEMSQAIPPAYSKWIVEDYLSWAAGH